MDNMKTYSEEFEIGRKKVRIILEFPHIVDPKDADRFEHMLKEMYRNKIQIGCLQSTSREESIPGNGGNGEMSHE